ncbi:hypothetical protein P43SY_004339 [Pythium insidiosum]|uniref:Uncharacterized protein n=1 Tax=Pythium insidiosum TaxID=114742 RepID=A0AAD5LEH7_PYTIN|nr:hypothetical protein P43SY_004339 [Pythium insidiosum]
MSPGKQRLQHLRTRTVDDDLAECNLTRRDLAQGSYSFRNVWGELRKRGWFAKTGGALSYDHFYIKPGKNTTEEFVENVDYFYGEAAIVQYAIDVQLFGEFHREDDDHDHDASADATRANASTPSKPTSLQATTLPSPTSAPSTSHRRTPMAKARSSHAARRQSTGSSGSDITLTLHPSLVNAKARRKSVAGPTRTWPNDHPSKGRHINDAISLDSSDEDDAGAVTGSPDADVRRSEPPPSPQQEPETLPTPNNHSGSADEVDTASSADASSTSGRPLLKTKRRSMQPSRFRYMPTPMIAKKVKSGPRGLLFERDPAAILEPKVEVETETEKKFTPVPMRSRCFGGAPAATPAAAPSTASHETHTTSATETSASSVSETTRVEVGDVMFPSAKNALYRVVIVSDGLKDEMALTITIEDCLTKDQWQGIFPDIAMLSTTDHAIPKEAIQSALEHCVQVLSASRDTAAVKDERGEESQSRLDLVVDDSGSLNMELTYPVTTWWGPVHVFRLEPLSRRAQVEAVVKELEQARKELSSTREELASAKREHEVSRREQELALQRFSELKKQHERLETQYQKLQVAFLQSQANASRAVPVASPQVPVPPGPRASTRWFCASSSWLTTAVPRSSEDSSETTMASLRWETIEEMNHALFELVNDDGAVDSIRVTCRGTYQLNVSVTHDDSRRLSVAIACGQSGEEKVLWPTIVQHMESKRQTSRVDQLVEFNVNDSLCVRLESGQVPRHEQPKSMWLDKFAPTNNLLMLTFVDKNMLCS